MKRSSNIVRKTISLLILFVAAIFVCADLPVAAQNTNSGSTMQGESMMMQNRNMNGNMRRRSSGRRRRGSNRRRSRAT
jgi:hypothetical protein